MRGQRHAPAAFYPRERPFTHCTGSWVGPRARLDGGKFRPTGIRSPDRPALSQSLYRLSYPSHGLYWVTRGKYTPMYFEPFSGVPDYPDFCLCKQRFLRKQSVLIFLIFVVPCIMLYIGEISPTRCNNCVFYSQWLYSTCFG